LNSTCNYFPGTHYNIHTNVIIDGQTVELYIEIPIHGPSNAPDNWLFDDGFRYTNDNPDGILKMEWGHEWLGLSIFIRDYADEDLFREYVDY